VLHIGTSLRKRVPAIYSEHGERCNEADRADARTGWTVRAADGGRQVAIGREHLLSDMHIGTSLRKRTPAIYSEHRERRNEADRADERTGWTVRAADGRWRSAVGRENLLSDVHIGTSLRKRVPTICKPPPDPFG